MTLSFEALVAKYGEDNARFLHDQLGNMTRNYGKIAFIEMGVEPDDRFDAKPAPTPPHWAGNTKNSMATCR